VRKESGGLVGPDKSDRIKDKTQRLRPSGGYRTLRSFRTTTVIYDATVRFCEKFINPRSRTIDQMVQAARSGRQNIAEGSRASATSSQTELRLVNVARASLDELLLDYEDYLRQHGRTLWKKDDPEAKKVRSVGRLLAQAEQQPEMTDYSKYSPWLEHPSDEVRANAIICLIHQANYLLDRQISALEKSFVEGGGYSEQLAAQRIAKRRGDVHDNNRNASAAAPNCPQCGQPMALRTAKKGANAGSQFWGCSAYPNCRATLSLDRTG
jgi:restriction system protein